MRGFTFEKIKKRYSLSEGYANFLTILRIYWTTMKKDLKSIDYDQKNVKIERYPTPNLKNNCLINRKTILLEQEKPSFG